MSTHKFIERVCWLCVALAMAVTVVFMNGEAIGIKAASKVMGYETRLFDTAEVHTIDIVMNDWDSFIDTCENEEYAVCSAVIDGEAFKNIGIRAKGNTSLSSVSSMNSDRYSFKIEFDQYDSTKTYHGLDKLSLNNLIQDNTYMKDFLAYEMMRKAGAAAPLCSFVYITVNGEDWGLYLAVEGVEEGFLQRNYSSNYGDLYKPDSMSFGGGRGNGKDFNMDDFDFDALQKEVEDQIENGDITLPDGVEIPEGFEMPDMGDMGGFPFGGQMGDPSEMFSEMLGGEMPDMGGFDFGSMPDMGNFGGFGGFAQGGSKEEGSGEGGKGGFQMPGFLSVYLRQLSRLRIG